MKKIRESGLDFIVDKLTNSIEFVATRESFETAVTRVLWKDRKSLTGKEWQFNWLDELKEEDREIYKLTTFNDPTVIHGLLSLTEKEDHIFLNLLRTPDLIRVRGKCSMVWRRIW